MNLESANSGSKGIYGAFKDEVCEDCKVRIEDRLSKMSKVDMALLVARPKNIHKKLGICQDCINNIHRKLLKNANRN